MEERRVPRGGAPVEGPVLTGSTQAALDRLLAQAADEPGLAVAVTEGPDVTARHCVGLANLSHGVSGQVSVDAWPRDRTSSATLPAVSLSGHSKMSR